MYDPYRSMYSRWDDSGNVQDYLGMAASDCGARTPSHHQTVETTEGDPATQRAVLRECSADKDKEEYADTIVECSSTDGSSDEQTQDLDARFIAYYERSHSGAHDDTPHDGQSQPRAWPNQGGAVRTHDELAREGGFGADIADGVEGELGCENDGDSADQGVVVRGDWVWDGEFWNNADGVSYHPGLQQYFSHGQRIFLSEDQKPVPDSTKLLEEWHLKRYQVPTPAPAPYNLSLATCPPQPCSPPVHMGRVLRSDPPT